MPFTARKLFLTALLIALISFLLIAFLRKSIPEARSYPAEIASPPSPTKFVLFTLPKTGTHLLRPLLEQLTGRSSLSYWSKEVSCSKTYLYDKNETAALLLPDKVQVYWLHRPVRKEVFIPILDCLQEAGLFLVTHAPFSPEMESLLKERNYVVFFLIRDPRDWAISVINHPQISGADLYGAGARDDYFLTLDFDHKVKYVIEGTSQYYSTVEAYHRFLPWMNSSICCTLRFEALLGPRGGYSEKEQLAELRKITDALHLDVSDETLLHAFDASFGTGSVFFQGKAGAWKERFNQEHKEMSKEILGDLLIELGYDQW